jgi:transcriptional regulator with XRE-family HTH domain
MKKTEVKKKEWTNDAIEILDRMMGADPEMHRLVQEARVNAEVAQLIYDVRTKAKLTQKQLAELIGTTQSVIARLEDADYEGHSLSMLQRIASALHKRLEIRFVPDDRKVAVLFRSNNQLMFFQCDGSLLLNLGFGHSFGASTGDGSQPSPSARLWSRRR